MNAKPLKLINILNLKKWKVLQDNLANITGMAITTVDYKGIPVIEKSNYTNFCTFIRSDFEREKHCQKCDSIGGLEGVRRNQAYKYLCHFNIVDIAIPIVVYENNNNRASHYRRRHRKQKIRKNIKHI
jgi:ligand-binding sensor protein